MASQKNQAPDFSEILERARGTSARAAIHGSFHLLEGWRDLSAVHDHEKPCSISGYQVHHRRGIIRAASSASA
jgi:hypothetical protein